MMQDLIPPSFNEDTLRYEPAVYSAPFLSIESGFSEKKKDNIEILDVVKFFVQYMKNDQLGMIANAHLGSP
jgi:hypothetical protein